jgi:cell shape-determining protein MreC
MNTGAITFSKEEFLKYQNSKFRFRRIVAIGTALAYFGVIVYMLWKIPPEHFDQYDNFFMMVTSFSTGIVMSYFAGSSYEETRINRQDLVDEFTSLNDHHEEMRQRRSSRRQPRQQNDQFDDNSEVPGNVDPSQQQGDNEVG